MNTQTTAMPIHTAMVLAAGLGTRLRPLTDVTPKPLINVGGSPVLFRTLRLLALRGIKRVVINTHYEATLLEQSVKAAAARENWPLQIHFSREKDLLETGGGIKKALPLLGENPFLVVNSDAVWLEEDYPLLPQLLQPFDPAKMDVRMAVVPLDRCTEFRGHGDFVWKNKRTQTALIQPKKKTDADLVYCGLHVTHPQFIAYEKETRFSLIRPWQDAMAAGRLHGILYDAPWVDMGSHTGLLAARQLVGEAAPVSTAARIVA